MYNHKTQVIKDLTSKTVTVIREFNAPIANVWRAYTEKELLDQWWGPAPWRAETKEMDFRAGGHWLYAMVGPENEKHWGRMNYIAIHPHESIEMEDVFCDENGNVNPELPTSSGKFIFTKTENGTQAEFRMTYNSAEDIQKIIEMGFEQGITICLEQLEALLGK